MFNKILYVFKTVTTFLFSDGPHYQSNNTWDYRLHRIIKNKYENGDYEVVHPVLHHYLFVIDGDYRVMGILEVLSAIDALSEFEEKQLK
ncbi:MAG: hypothetical protein HRS57_02170 [Mycoplasmataceae bacterium]|nr:hypothetical protein [Mycoplasmataceae bacterium]